MNTKEKGIFSRINTQTTEISGGGGAQIREMGEGMIGYDFKGNRVLLIEDNDLNREIVQELLEVTGMEVDTAEDGKEAVEKFKKAEEDYYKVILMDIEMPVMDGYEASKTIRESSHPAAKTIPILAMTGSFFCEDREKAIESGMNEHIEKPIDTERLFRIIQGYLDKNNKRSSGR